VIASEWRFANGSEEDDADRPFQRWRYTIYPSGDVFVHVECTAAWPGWEPHQLGLAVNLNRRLGFTTQVHEVAGLNDPEPLRHVAYAAAVGTPPAQAASMLYTLADSRRTPRIIHPDPAKSGRLSFVATGSLSDAPTAEWTCRINLLSASDADEVNLATRAVSYAFPSPLAVQVGQPAMNGDASAAAPDPAPPATVTDAAAPPAPPAPPARGAQSFDPATGCYALRAEDGLVRFSLDAPRHLFLSPAFCIVGSQDKSAWVYVDNMIFEPTARDANGDLIFQLPGRAREGDDGRGSFYGKNEQGGPLPAGYGRARGPLRLLAGRLDA
jgi:hypothetical protein